MSAAEAFVVLTLGVLLGAFLVHVWHDSIEDIRWWRSRPDIRNAGKDGGARDGGR